jgi:hypothetical protein
MVLQVLAQEEKKMEISIRAQPHTLTHAIDSYRGKPTKGEMKKYYQIDKLLA